MAVPPIQFTTHRLTVTEHLCHLDEPTLASYILSLNFITGPLLGLVVSCFILVEGELIAITAVLRAYSGGSLSNLFGAEGED